MIRAGCGALLLALCVTMLGAAARAAPALEPLDHAVCRLIANAAHANDLPVAFVTRIIWQESAFRAGVVSPAGAQGIAQFMPGTAHERGLADPFDPEQAIPKAAALLAELRQQFGSLDAAAAAYNAGPGRVDSWLHGQAGLPAETRAYVRYVTEQDADAAVDRAEAWPGGEGASTPDDARSCVALTVALRRERNGADEVDGVPWAPWGVQLAGNFSKALALAAFERARRRYAAVIGDGQPMIIGRLLRSRGTRRFYQLSLPAGSRAAAATLCRRIEAVGGNCVVMRS